MFPLSSGEDMCCGGDGTVVANLFGINFYKTAWVLLQQNSKPQQPNFVLINVTTLAAG